MKANPQPGCFNKDFLLVFLFALVIFGIKQFFSWRVYGTNDVTYWIGFSNIIAEYGTFNIYSLVRIYNHPPVVSWLLKVLHFLAIKSRLSFPFLLRSLPILCDFASIFIIWPLLKKFKVKNIVPIAIICAINPINFFISGFHGNLDTVFIFLVLLAVYFLHDDKIILSGLIYGLSMCVKIVPIILVPVFLFFLKGKEKKAIFILSFLTVLFLAFVPYLIYDFHSLLRNIFFYSSLKGIWGLGHIFLSLMRNENAGNSIRVLAHTLFKLHISYGIIIFFAINIFLSYVLMFRKKSNLLEGIFLIFCFFLVITPGFGVQYLSWLSFLAIMVFPILGTLYGICGGLFLFRVYSYWGGSAPPYYANSDKVGQWVGFNMWLDILLWLLIVAMLAMFLLKKIYAHP